MKRALALVLAFAANTAFAGNDADARLRDQLRQSIIESRQLQDQNADLQAKLAAKPQLSPEQAAELKSSKAAASRESVRAKQIQEQLDITTKALAEYRNAYAEQQKQIAKLNGDVDTGKKNADAITVQLKGCEARNHQMTALFDEMTGQFRHRGVVDALLAREPLTGLKRAEIERLTETYRDKADAASVEAAPAAPPSQ